MPINLDSPIYVVPCGVPGDLDALSGRAHICEDRMRIAVTECTPFEPGADCPSCEPGTTPLHYSARVGDVAICGGCVYGGGLSYRYDLETGSLNGDFVLTQMPSFSCRWISPVIARIRERRWAGHECQGTPHYDIIVEEFIMLWGDNPGGFYLTIHDWLAWGKMAFGHQQPRAWDCPPDFLCSNQIDCTVPGPGLASGGTIRLEPGR